MEFEVYGQTIHYSDGIIDYAKYFSEFEEKRHNELNTSWAEWVIIA